MDLVDIVDLMNDDLEKRETKVALWGIFAFGLSIVHFATPENYTVLSGIFLLAVAVTFFLESMNEIEKRGREITDLINIIQNNGKEVRLVCVEEVE